MKTDLPWLEQRALEDEDHYLPAVHVNVCLK